MQICYTINFQTLYNSSFCHIFTRNNHAGLTKITSEDWRNRDKWEDYELAACDMIDRTSTEIAKWTLIEANDKHYARLKALRVLIERIEKAID